MKIKICDECKEEIEKGDDIKVTEKEYNDAYGYHIEKEPLHFCSVKCHNSFLKKEEENKKQENK